MVNVAEQERIADFLAQKRIAVMGVAHAGVNTATGIFNRFKAAGYQVYAVNPHGGSVADEPLYRSVAEIPGGVDAAVVVTGPAHALQVVQDCQRAQVTRVWFHDNTLMQGSSSADAIAFAETHAMRVITTGCPMMHLQPDVAHACMHWVLEKTGRISA